MSKRYSPRSLIQVNEVEEIIFGVDQNASEISEIKDDECVRDLREADQYTERMHEHKGSELRDRISDNLTDSDAAGYMQRSSNDEEIINDYDLCVDQNIDASRIQESRLEGRCLIDLPYFMDQLHLKFDNHHRGLNCPFSDLVVVNFRHYGLKLQIFLQCRMCHFQESIWTDRVEDDQTMDVNHSAVLASMAIGIGHSQMQEFFASLNVHSMASKTYLKCGHGRCGRKGCKTRDGRSS